MKQTTIIIAMFLLSITNSVLGQENQNVILKNFESGKYTVYKLNAKKKFEKVKKMWPVEITKQGTNVSKVLVKRAGILDELFEADIPGYPAYFGFNNYRLSFIKNYAVYYEWNGKQQAKTKYILVKSGGSFSGNLEAVNKSIASYAIATFKNQTGARANVKEAKAELAETERKINSLEGKLVKKIEIQLLSNPSKVAHFSEAIKYGVIATLKDGGILKTSNLGGKIPWDDFVLTHEGASNTVDEVRVDENAANIPNDLIKLKITSKYHSSLKASKSINTTNDLSIQVNQNGFWGWERHKYMTVFQGVDGQHAGRADNLVVKVKTVSHKQTGVKINKIEIYNTTDEKLVAQYKLSPSTELIINAKGGQGAKGSKGRKSDNKGGNGGNGGAGGNVTIIKAPSVLKCNITINNHGGKGGNGGAPYYSSGIKGDRGVSGDNGKIINQVKKVVLKF